MGEGALELQGIRFYVGLRCRNGHVGIFFRTTDAPIKDFQVVLSVKFSRVKIEAGANIGECYKNPIMKDGTEHGFEIGFDKLFTWSVFTNDIVNSDHKVFGFGKLGIRPKQR